jgi:hypothetical protein
VSFVLLNVYHRRWSLFGVDSRALTVTECSKLLAAITSEFEAGRLKPSPSRSEERWRKFVSYTHS